MHATVVRTVAPLLAEARPSSTQISQLLRGHHAEVLEGVGDWLRVRGVDGYTGWCHAGYLSVAPWDAATLRSGWSDERRMSLGCTVRAPSGAQMALPLGGLLEPDEVVVAGVVMNYRGRARSFVSDVDVIVRHAVDLFTGAPYQWGGVTPWGADCSGFVQTLFALHGIQLPRDAWQQGERGTPVPVDMTALYPGDLFFFSDRDDARITHVALSMGGTSVAHCSLAHGGFNVDALNADTAVAAYLRKTFQFSRRIV